MAAANDAVHTTTHTPSHDGPVLANQELGEVPLDVGVLEGEGGREVRGARRGLRGGAEQREVHRPWLLDPAAGSQALVFVQCAVFHRTGEATLQPQLAPASGLPLCPPCTPPLTKSPPCFSLRKLNRGSADEPFTSTCGINDGWAQGLWDCSAPLYMLLLSHRTPHVRWPVSKRQGHMPRPSPWRRGGT